VCYVNYDGKIRTDNHNCVCKNLLVCNATCVVFKEPLLSSVKYLKKDSHIKHSKMFLFV
jgi:hypothetical protein